MSIAVVDALNKQAHKNWTSVLDATPINQVQKENTNQNSNIKHEWKTPINTSSHMNTAHISHIMHIFLGFCL